MLRNYLDDVPLWRGEHVAVRQLVEDFARYLYLPQLVGPRGTGDRFAGIGAEARFEVPAMGNGESPDIPYPLDLKSTLRMRYGELTGNSPQNRRRLNAMEEGGDKFLTTQRTAGGVPSAAAGERPLRSWQLAASSSSRINSRWSKRRAMRRVDNACQIVPQFTMPHFLISWA
jgi:hypothetical protein